MKKATLSFPDDDWGEIWAWLYHLAQSRFPRLDHEDLVQEAITRLLLFVHLDGIIKNQKSVRPLLKTILFHVGLDVLRQRRELSGMDLDTFATDTSEIADLVEVADAARTYLGQVSTRQRAILILKCFYHMTHDQIAGLLGISVRTVTEDLMKVRDQYKG